MLANKLFHQALSFLVQGNVTDQSVTGSLPELDLGTDEQVSWEGKQTLHRGDSLAGDRGSQSELSR